MEFNLNHLRALAGMPMVKESLEEAKKPKCTCDEDEAKCKVHAKEQVKESSVEYDDSAEFTEDMTDIHSSLKKIADVVKADKWSQWMNLTDKNFGTGCADISDDFIGALTEAIKKYEELLDELDKAQ